MGPPNNQTPIDLLEAALIKNDPRTEGLLNGDEPYVSYSKTYNESLGFPTHPSRKDYAVLIPFGDWSNLPDQKPKDTTKKPDRIKAGTPSALEEAFKDVLSFGGEAVKGEPYFIDITHLWAGEGPWEKFFTEEDKDGQSIAKTLDRVIGPASSITNVVIRFLVGVPSANWDENGQSNFWAKEEVKYREIFKKYIKRPNTTIYVGHYSPNFKT
jgi:hypothetical protein